MTRSEASRAKWADPAFRARACAALRRAAAFRDPPSEETRAKLAAAKRANWADAEYRARQIAAVERGKAASFRRVVDLP